MASSILSTHFTLSTTFLTVLTALCISKPNRFLKRITLFVLGFSVADEIIRTVFPSLSLIFSSSLKSSSVFLSLRAKEISLSENPEV